MRKKDENKGREERKGKGINELKRFQVVQKKF